MFNEACDVVKALLEAGADPREATSSTIGTACMFVVEGSFVYPQKGEKRVLTLYSYVSISLRS